MTHPLFLIYHECILHDIVQNTLKINTSYTQSLKNVLTL